MTNIEPVAGDVEVRVPATHGLAEIIADLDAQRAEMVESGDWQGLVKGGMNVQSVIDDLRTLVEQTKLDIATIVDVVGERRGSKTYAEIPGIGAVEVSGGYDRKNWMSEKLLSLILYDVLDSFRSGEDSDAFFEDLYEELFQALSACLPVTGSLQWRLGGLKGQRIDPDDFHDRTERPRKARLPKVKP